MPPRPSLADRVWPWFLRGFGAALIAYETLGEQVDRPYLLALAAGMIGLPEVAKWERKRNEDR